LDTTLAGMRSPVDSGVFRPTQDERSRTTFLMANDLSLPLRRQIAQVTGADLLSGPFARC